MNNSDYHVSVLLNEAIDLLNIKEDGIYVDMTLGRAGHSKAILSKLNSKGLLIGIDQDEEALKFSQHELEKIGKSFKLVKSNFYRIDEILNELNIKEVDGILFDLGVSSPQFDEDYRGFSYRMDSKLDMRMDLNRSLTAYDIVNNYSLEKLINIFKNYGEEKFSYSIARNIIKARENKKIETTFELVDIIKKSKPDKELRKPGHPAKQVFQALRIEVNDELNVLEEAIKKSLKLLKLHGRIVVITFQSLEDKIVKRIFKENSVIEGNRLNDYVMPSEEKKPEFALVNKKVIIPTEKEIINNHRARSAKLRAIEKVRWLVYERQIVQIK